MLFPLVERAQDQFDEEQARRINKKIAKNQFGFDDFLSQIPAGQENGKYERFNGNDSWCW